MSTYAVGYRRLTYDNVVQTYDIVCIQYRRFTTTISYTINPILYSIPKYTIYHATVWNHVMPSTSQHIPQTGTKIGLCPSVEGAIRTSTERISDVSTASLRFSEVY